MTASRRRWFSTVLLAASLLTCAVGCDWLSETAPSGTSTTASLPAGAVPVPSSALSPMPPPVGSRPTAAVPGGMPPSFAELVHSTQLAVATIKAWVQRENAFGKKVTVAEGMGTAFVYDTKGYLLTNHHVISGASEIAVGFTDGREFKATVVGSDKPTDVAVIKIEADKLVALSLGDSDSIRVGDWVVAIGNPFGLEHTVSAGILSAKGRTRDDVKGLDPTGYFNFLQTDASINPGNSGGPLINLAGQVVGINTAVRANANNIGFAIPVNMVRQLLPMLVRDGKVRRSAIGVYVEPVGADEVRRLDLGKPRGAIVKRVIAGGAADLAGLAAGDVILAFEAKEVADPNQLRWLASIAGVGATVTLRVARGSRVFDMRVRLAELPETDQ